MRERQHSAETDAAMQRPFIRIMIGTGIIIALFYFASRAFDKVVDSVVESKHQWVADRFTKSVNYIHKEWMISNRSQVIELDYYVDENTSNKITIQLNRYGWPLNISESDNELNCLNLWMLFAHEIGHSQSIMDLTTHLEVQQTTNGCRYYQETEGGKKFLFDYELRTGKVSSTDNG